MPLQSQKTDGVSRYMKQGNFSMARTNPGPTKTNGVQEFCTFNVLKGRIHEEKVQHLPYMNIHYEKPRATTDKQWTDQSLLSIENVNIYLAESDAFQRISFASIIEKGKQYERNQTNRLLSLFDTHYGMQIRFRRDKTLNGSSDRNHAAIAKYYRLLSNERNKPCERHQRRTLGYEERYLHKLLTSSTAVKTSSQPYVLSKLTKLPSIKRTSQ